MSSYFFDTSALIKRYVAEQGHDWVSAICAPQAGNLIIIAEITLTEAITTMSRMMRERPPRLTAEECDRLIALFEEQVQRSYIVVQVNRTTFTDAAHLARKHPLRAYDAVQLACALAWRDDAIATSQPAPTFVCADHVLLNIATLEGLAIENPSLHA